VEVLFNVAIYPYMNVSCANKDLSQVR